jgi:hypothetical protein
MSAALLVMSFLHQQRAAVAYTLNANLAVYFIISGRHIGRGSPGGVSHHSWINMAVQVRG